VYARTCRKGARKHSKNLTFNTPSCVPLRMLSACELESSEVEAVYESSPADASRLKRSFTAAEVSDIGLCSPQHGRTDGDDEAWNIFSDPLEEQRRQLNFRSNSKTVIQDLDEIEMELEDYATNTLETLRSLSFTAPRSAADCLALTEGLLHLSSATGSAVKQLQQRTDAQLLRSQRTQLNRVRGELIEVLYSVNNRYTDEPHQFTLGYVDWSSRLDTVIFRGALQCCRCLAADPSSAQRLSSITPEHEMFAELRRHNIISPRIVKRPLLELTVPELLQAITTLESIWCYAPPAQSLSAYLDLLMTRLGQIVCSPQPERVYGAITDYRKQIDAEQYEATQRMLEDFCWSFGPMYLKLAVHKTLSQRTAACPLHIGKTDIRRIETFVVQNSLDMKNTSLTQTYIVAYMNFALRPSERRRYRRDYPHKSNTGAAVIEKLRGQDAKNHIMGVLSKAPWHVVREKLLERSELDVLILMMLNAYVCNAVGNNFEWLPVFVHFNKELLAQANVVAFLDRPYPLIVQSFNAFCVYYQGILYEHRRAASAYAHWLSIMFSPAFKGKFLKFNLTSLHTLLPESARLSVPTTR